MKAGNRIYTSQQNLPEIIPVFPLSGALLLPGGNLALNIFEPRYLAMVEYALNHERIIGMIQPEPTPDKNDKIPGLSKLGCLGRLTGFQEDGDGQYKINLTGICRFCPLEEIETKHKFRMVKFRSIDADFASGDINDPLMKLLDRPSLINTFRRFLETNNMETDWEAVEKTDDEALVTALCMLSPYGPAEKQALLEAKDLNARAQTLVAITEIALAYGDDTISLQ